MNKYIKRDNRIAFISGIIALVLKAISLVIACEYETTRIGILLRIVIIPFAVFFFVICNLKVDGKDNERQVLAVDGVCLLTHIVFSVATAGLVIGTRYYVQMYSEFLWITGTIVAFYILWKRDKERTKKYLYATKQNKIHLLAGLVFSAILIFFSIETDGLHFVWDANQSYSVIQNVRYIPAFNIRDTFGFSHTSAAYFYPVVILNYLLGSIKWSFFAYHAVLLMIASFSVVFLMKETRKDKSPIIHILVAFAVLFSPFIFGISPYYASDFGIMCLAPLVFLSAAKRDWVLFFFWGLLIGFMKESGFLFFGFVCLAILISEMKRSDESRLRLIVRKRTYSWIAALAIWLYFFDRYAKWNGIGISAGMVVALIVFIYLALFLIWLLDRYKIQVLRKETVFILLGLFAVFFAYECYATGMKADKDAMGFLFSFPHIIKQSKVYFLLNFEWLYILIIAICSIFIVRKNKRFPEMTLVYVIPAVMLYLFNCAFVTYENPRYMGAYPICILLLVITMISELRIPKRVELVALGGLLVLSVASSVFSVDPLSAVAFYTADTGSRLLYNPTSIGHDPGGDQCVYNRQYYGLDVVLDKTLEKGIDCKDEVIAVSTGESELNWTIDGGRYSYYSNEGKRDFDEFWNIKEETREPGYAYDYYSDPGLKPIVLTYIYPDDDIISFLSKERSFIYIYIPTLNAGKEKTVYDNAVITEEGSFKSHGWTMNYIRGKVL